jgi:predicted phage terminase large subunit-like protein
MHDDKLMELTRTLVQKELVRRQHCNDRYDWAQHARPAQLPPPGDWNTWCIIAGRGFGKTRAGAETIRQWATAGLVKRIALVGSTQADVRNVMIEGESGLLNVHPPGTVQYYPSTNQLRWQNGCLSTGYSAEAHQALRGPQFDCAWVDELCKFDRPRLVWDQLMFSLRLSDHPRVLVTTTPRPCKLLRDLCRMEGVVVTRGNSHENTALSKTYFANLQQYKGTTLERQEVCGEILDDVGLWRQDYIKYHQGHREPLPHLQHVVVGLDPAVTTHGNETGIVTVGVRDGQYFVLDDASGNHTPAAWASAVREQYNKYNARLVVAEGNQGGEMIQNILQDLPVTLMYAQRSKVARAMPIVQLYEAGRVYHVRKFEALERQMDEFDTCVSPDRVDALVWAIAFLDKYG